MTLKYPLLCAYWLYCWYRGPKWIIITYSIFIAIAVIFDFVVWVGKERVLALKHVEQMHDNLRNQRLKELNSKWGRE